MAFVGGPMDGQEMPAPEAGPEGLPPELAAMLGGAGPPPEAAAQEAPKSPADVLGQIRSLLEQVRQLERDEEDLLELEKISTMVQGLFAKNQKEQDGMMQGKASPRAMRRASGAY